MNADVILISEPNKNFVNKGGWYVDPEQLTAVKITNAATKARETGYGTGFVWTSVRDFCITCVYISPNIDSQQENRIFQELTTHVRARKDIVILAGDFNAKARLWGSKTENPRGKRVLKLLAELDMITANAGDTPTFERGGCSSYIDLTCVPTKRAHRIDE